MEMTNFLSFVLMATLLVMSPGPNGLLIAKTVTVAGKKAGYANIVGFIAAFYIHGSLSILGISIILLKSAEAFFVVKMLGAAYLIWLGIKAILSAKRKPLIIVNNDTSAPSNAQSHTHPRLGSAFFEGFITNVLNPKVSMFYLAAFPQFLSINDNMVQAYSMVSAHAMINTLWFVLMITLLGKMKSVTSSHGFSQWFQTITGSIFVGLGVKLALLKPLHND